MSAILFAVVLINFTTLEKDSSKTTDYYSLCNFDFIIPSPWYTQIKELKELKFVNEVIPYYITKKTVSLEKSADKSTDIDLYLFDEGSDLSVTAYASELLIEGNKLQENGIVIDENSAMNLGNVSVGDKVSFLLNGEKIELSVNGIVRSDKNLLYPTAAVYFSGKVKSIIESSFKKLSYSGAFVKVNDTSSGEDYFNKKYRAMGKVGDRSWYNDDATYERVKSSIESSSAALEVRNIADERSNSVSKTSEAKSSNQKKLLIIVAIVFFGNLLAWIINILVSQKEFRQRIKHGKKIGSIKMEFKLGSLFACILFCAAVYIFREMTAFKWITCIIAADVLSTLIVCLISDKVVDRK